MSIVTILFLVLFWSCLIPLLLGDAVTYGMEKIVSHRTTNNGVVNYFVTGMLTQPDAAFAFMLDLPALRNDTMKLVPYSNRRARFSQMTTAILEDATKNRYLKVRIFAIGVGATVAYAAAQRKYAKQVKGSFELECYLINPCPAARFLEPKVKRRLLLLYPWAILVELVLGPLAFLPLMKRSGQRFSAALALNQIDQVLFQKSLLSGHERYIRGVILSRDDEYLDNAEIHDLYRFQAVKCLNKVGHADTIGKAKAYRQAMEQLLWNPHD